MKRLAVRALFITLCMAFAGIISWASGDTIPGPKFGEAIALGFSISAFLVVFEYALIEFA